MDRRTFLHAALASGAAGSLRAAGPARPPRILLRNGWQDVNIGDIAHTPGMLALLEKHVPDAEVTFWPWRELRPAAMALVRRRFPKLRVVEGKLGPDGRGTTDAMDAAVASADFFLHGSGPATIAWADAAAFRARTGKPFGVYGVTYGLYGTPEKPALGDASFLYFRDSASLARAKREGIRAPIMGLAPDAAFAFDARDDATAVPFLKANGLDDGKFLCCIPRYRHTPSWSIPSKNAAFDAKKHARNEATKERDHAPLREAIAAVVGQTDFKVLVCPEDETQMEIGRRMIVGKLPDAVRSRVVWRETYWMPDEALSVYSRSAGLFGNEMHSPIMCVGNGIPAVVCRSAEQSTKGLMWSDIGLGDWLFDLDSDADLARIAPTVLAIARDPAAAKAKAAVARKLVAARQAETMAVLAKELAVIR